MILLLSWKLGVRGFREDEKEERKKRVMSGFGFRLAVGFLAAVGWVGFVGGWPWRWI